MQYVINEEDNANDANESRVLTPALKLEILL
jgi:hypothetical protein